MAAFAGHLEVVRLLLQARADKEKVMTDARQATPSALAARNEHVEPWAAQKSHMFVFFFFEEMRFPLSIFFPPLCSDPNPGNTT